MVEVGYPQLPVHSLRHKKAPASITGAMIRSLVELEYEFHDSSSTIESRYARDYIPKFQAEFGVAEEEPDGPF